MSKQLVHLRCTNEKIIYCGIIMVFFSQFTFAEPSVQISAGKYSFTQEGEELIDGLRRVLPGIFISRMTVMQSSKFPHGMRLSLAMENILYPEMVTN